MIDQAMILAAGKGTRLRRTDDDLPKPLQEVGGVPLLARTIRTLASAGVRRIVVVIGYQADLVRAAVADQAAYAVAGVTVALVENPDFELANGVSVLAGARAPLLGAAPFLLSMADHVYAPAVPRAVAASDLAAADLYLATDPRIDTILDIDDATKVRSEDGRIAEIGKQLTRFDRIDCGVFAVTPVLVSMLERVRAERGDCSLTDGVRQLAGLGRARIADIGDAFWQDVDTPADRDHAERALGGHDPLPR